MSLDMISHKGSFSFLEALERQWRGMHFNINIENTAVRVFRYMLYSV